MIEWIDQLSFENALALVVKERKLNYLNKYGLVKGNAVLIYNWFMYD